MMPVFHTILLLNVNMTCAHLSEVDSESAEVRHDAGTQQHVSSEVEVLVTEHPSIHRPAFFLAAKTTYQLLCSI